MKKLIINGALLMFLLTECQSVSVGKLNTQRSRITTANTLEYPYTQPIHLPFYQPDPNLKPQSYIYRIPFSKQNFEALRESFHFLIGTSMDIKMRREWFMKLLTKEDKARKLIWSQMPSILGIPYLPYDDQGIRVCLQYHNSHLSHQFLDDLVSISSNNLPIVELRKRQVESFLQLTSVKELIKTEKINTRKISDELLLAIKILKNSHKLETIYQMVERAFMMFMDSQKAANRSSFGIPLTLWLKNPKNGLICIKAYDTAKIREEMKILQSFILRIDTLIVDEILQFYQLAINLVKKMTDQHPYCRNNIHIVSGNSYSYTPEEKIRDYFDLGIFNAQNHDGVISLWETPEMNDQNE